MVPVTVKYIYINYTRQTHTLRTRGKECRGGGGSPRPRGRLVGVEAAGARRVKGACRQGVSDASELMFSIIARLMMIGEYNMIKASCITNVKFCLITNKLHHIHSVGL